MAQSMSCCGSTHNGDNVVEPLGGGKATKSTDSLKLDISNDKQHQTIEVKTAADLNGNAQRKD